MPELRSPEADPTPQEDMHPILTSKLARLAAANPELYKAITNPKEEQK